VNTSLSDSEDDLEDFKRENRIFDPNEAVREVSSKLTELESERADLQFSLYLYEKINKEIEENEEVSTFLVQLAGRNHDGSLDNEINALHQLLDERSQILIQSTYETEVYKAHEMKIESQKNILLQIIKNEIATLKDKIGNVDEQISLLDSRYGTLPEKQAVYGRLERLYSIHEKFYSLLLEKKAEFSITRAGFVTKNIILERAIPINFPISPKKALIISSALIVGFVLSFLLIVVKYLLHDQIDIISDIEPYTDAAILGIIPKYKREIPISQLLVDKNPKSIIAEAFRSIRTNLQFISNEKDAKIIAVTSTISGEGKTFNAINLAGVIAFSGKKVVILDLDMRKPKIHLGFNVENNKGISTLLIGKDKIDDCIISSSLENLHFITAGPVPPNPSELIISKRMDELLEYLKTQFDIIIIDTPPVGIVSDGIPMIKRADFPIYILRANYSRKIFIHNINKLIDENKVKNISLILNGIDLARLKYGYGYNYSYSYGYGYGYGYTYGYGYGYYEEDMKEPSRLDKIKAFLFKDKKG
jgi:capsular exopolysaccharide synthesis family protein